MTRDWSFGLFGSFQVICQHWFSLIKELISRDLGAETTFHINTIDLGTKHLIRLQFKGIEHLFTKHLTETLNTF